ncbi:unnamed protein product [Schistocephalus solidus]|uniref:Heterochromatin protein 1 n=1 Tax=Schistocephalus solidus TaxID=70667 RepID=A0A183SAK5_SCHSO|nr:unnamed protein product [Schistocephalus solidus]
MSTKGDVHESEDSDEIAEDEYQVERITKVRIRNGRKEYFLKWKGYPEEENTWEPEENLDCPDLIKEFEERMKKERGPATPSRSLTSTITKRGKSSTASPGSSSDATVEPAKNSKRNRLSASAGEDEDSAAESKKSAEETPKVYNNLAPLSSFNLIVRIVSGTPSKIARGFSRGLKPDRIIGATDSSGELMFLIKWKDSSEADLVPAREANVKCPQTVIRFYEERLTWHTPDTRGDSSTATSFTANTAAPTVSTATETTQPVETPSVQISDGAAATVV